MLATEDTVFQSSYGGIGFVFHLGHHGSELGSVGDDTVVVVAVIVVAAA